MTEGRSYRKPTEEEVLAVKLRLNRLQLRRAFYSKLENPHWVSALAREGVFKDPPETKVMPDGLVQSEMWPEIDYLVRMAPLASRDVADAVLPIVTSSNQWVRRGVMEAATVMDPADVARLVPSMSAWPDDELADFRIDPRNVATVIVRLLSGGQHARGLQLAEAYFAPRPPKTRADVGQSEPIAGIEGYWYKEVLPEVSLALGRGRIRTLLRWLKSYQEHSKSVTRNPSHDSSYIWRPSIRSTKEYSSHEMGDSLVDELRSAAVASLPKGTDPVGMLLDEKQPLLRRIALDVVAEAVEQLAQGKVPDGAAPGYHARLAAIANRILSDSTFVDSSYRGEYLPFVRACLQWRKIDIEPFFEEIRQGPLSLRDARRESFARGDVTPEQAEQRRNDYRKRWQHTMLSLVGAADLPTDLGTALAELDKEYGTIEAQDRAVQFESFTGPSSPIDLEAMRAMDEDDLLNHLRNWHPDPEAFGGPSHEGQGRVLAELIGADPLRFVGQLDSVKELRPTYLRHIVQGWRSSVEKGSPPPWDVVLSFCVWAVGLSESEQFVGEGGSFDDDRDYQGLKLEVLRLIDAGLASRSSEDIVALPADVAMQLVSVLATFAASPEPTPEHEGEFGGENMDPLTLSLNTTRPIAVRALIRLVNRLPETEAGQTALRLLDEHVAGRDPSLAVAAAFGEGTGRLYDSVRPWLEERVGILFGESAPTTAWQQVALSTVLAVHRVHISLLELLRVPLMLSIEQMSSLDLASGWRHHSRSFPQLIGDWLAIAIVSGRMGLNDELMAAWLDNADPALRGEVLGHLAWQTTHWEDVPAEVLRRVAELWDSRIEHVRSHPDDADELIGVYWFALNDKLDIQWWLPRLEYATSVIPSYDMHGMVGEKLALAASVDPATALSILENVLPDRSSDRQMMHYDLLEHAAPSVIADCLDSGDETVSKRALDLMNLLGDRGYLQLEGRVAELRSRPAHD